MSSEHLASAQTELKGDLGASWNILDGASANYTDLGIARRFGGAAAAYSLRDIGAMNGRVVKARRDVDGDGTDKEEDFSANQVQSGVLEDWVNGKLESTLPADVATAAAAYSLRKVKADYSDDAVRIRRTSDSVEVNVAFDSDDKVSTSSSISVVSGETNATTVAEFLSEERTTFVTNPVFSVSGGGGSITQEVTNTSASFSFQGGTNNFIRDARKPANLGAETGDTISFDVTASGVSTDFSVRLRVVGANTEIISPPINDLNNGTRTITLTVGSNSPAGYFAFTNLNTASTGTVTIDNIKVVGKSATVHTWYDQAGSNDAVQETAANQPKIAENGALLADGIDFDGTDDYLEADGVSSIYTGTDEAHSSFVVVNSDAATTTQYILGIGSSTSGNPLRNTLFHSGGNLGWQVRDDAGTLKTDLSANPYVANQTYLVSALNSGTTIDFNTNSVINDNGTDADVGASTIDTVYIGTRANSPTGYLNGSIQELVFYASDQSDNRFKIESNINNYYGLYNDANDLEGTEFTGTSGTYTNNSKDGVTFVGTQTQSFVGIELKESVPVGETVYISFNCSHDAYSESTLVGLRASTVTGANASASYSTPQDGFGVASLTSTDANAKFVTFQIRQDSPTFTVSDFKVSRIVRNGFIETLYDQSGNGNNATQSSATKQPYIIQNGGQCKMTNGNPAVMGARYASDAIQFLEMDTGISDPYTMFSSMYTTRSFSLLFGGTNVGSSPRILVNTNGIQPLLNATDDFGVTSTDNTIDSVVTLFSAENGGTAVLRKNGTQIDSLARVDDEIRPMKFLFRHQNNIANKGVFFDSFIVYGSDKTSDFTEIENNLKLANNIS